jgi:hypothetical protein
MSDEPTYPKDAPVGSGTATDQAAGTSSGAAETGAGGGGAGDDRRKKYVKAGVAVGIGSAAIVAALLYAGRGKKGGDRSDS